MFMLSTEGNQCVVQQTTGKLRYLQVPNRGSCYFAGPDDRSIAEEFNQSYKEGIIEVSIDRASYERYFKPLEYRYDEKDGGERIEVVIPQSLFPILNQFPRVLKPR